MRLSKSNRSKLGWDGKNAVNELIIRRSNRTLDWQHLPSVIDSIARAYKSTVHGQTRRPTHTRCVYCTSGYFNCERQSKKRKEKKGGKICNQTYGCMQSNPSPSTLNLTICRRYATKLQGLEFETQQRTHISMIISINHVHCTHEIMIFACWAGQLKETQETQDSILRCAQSTTLDRASWLAFGTGVMYMVGVALINQNEPISFSFF